MNTVETLSPSHLKQKIGETRLHYLAIVWMLVRRDLKVKYRGTLLGYLWSMLNPLLFMITITVVFSHMVRGIDNYNIYVLAGILFWNMVSLTIVAGTGSLVANSQLIQKIRLPIWVFPLVPLGSSLTNLLLAMIPYALICLFSGVGVSAQLFALPVILLLTATFLAGITLGLSSLNVFFRDVGHVLEPIMTLLFYATPVIYNRHSLSMSDGMNNILILNPFVHFIEAFRATIFPGADPISLTQVMVLTGLALLSLAVGSLIYKQAKPKIPLNL